MKTSKRAMKGLRGSIKKWSKIVYSEGIDEGTKDCPLCKLYNDPGRLSFKSICLTCPVYRDSKATYCSNTPYIKWTDHHQREHNKMSYPLKIECKRCAVLAKRELNYLIKLEKRLTH